MKPRRLPEGARGRKISVSISADDLKTLSARAKRLYDGNVSAVVHEMVAALRRDEAADDLLRLLGGDGVTEAQMQRIRDEVAAPAPSRKRRKAA